MTWKQKQIPQFPTNIGLMSSSQGQGELFRTSRVFYESPQLNQGIELNTKFLEAWQEKVYSHQSKFLKGIKPTTHQTSLFKENTKQLIDKFEPLKLTPLPINFWRCSTPSQSGPAIYVVTDQLDNHNKFLILYIGETIAADQRWKGDHDCKTYLDNYCETLQKAGITNQLSIRFWNDVPKETLRRRKIEQALIQRWLPPFNKETRTRWQTPFTSENSFPK